MVETPTQAAPFVRTLLVVEDDAVERMIYERVIRRSGSVGNMVSFTYAEQALAYLEDVACKDVDAILLDINMPRMDGFEFLDEVERRFGTEFRAKVFMLTSSTNPKDAERAKRYQAVQDFLNKPLTSSLVERIFEDMHAA